MPTTMAMAVPMILTVRLFTMGRIAVPAIGLISSFLEKIALKLSMVGLFGNQYIFPPAAVHSGKGLKAMENIQ